MELSQDPTIGPIMFPEAIDQPEPQRVSIVEFSSATTTSVNTPAKPIIPPRRVFSMANITADT
jgi:hypothetical protein